MPQPNQEWYAFALFGVGVLLTSVMPALPTAVNTQHFALGTLLVFGAAMGLFVTSRTVVDAAVGVEERVRRLAG